MRAMAQKAFLHVEIPAVDARGAGTFYQEVFGWEIRTNEEHNYVTFEAGHGMRGGFVGPQEPTYRPDRLLVYLLTEDIEGKLAEVEAHGGKVVMGKTDIPHVGSWAIFSDPAGNEVGLFNRIGG
jgi:predicted enzyme related to lactoylglutathione lyase